MTNKELISKLEQNMIAYHENSEAIKELEAKQDIMKKENLTILQQLNLKDYASSNLKISIVQNKKKIGVDENKLSALIGSIDHLKRVPVEIVMAGIKDRTLPAESISCIMTIDQAPYTKIVPILKEKTKVNISD